MKLTSFNAVEDIQTTLDDHHYITRRSLATSIYLSLKMGMPIFLEGEPGVGKTEVAKVLSRILDTELIRLQCYEGLDVHNAIYEWNYSKQILQIRLLEAGGETDNEKMAQEIFGQEFLIKRPLYQALEHRGETPAVLLIDELDRADEEFEAYLLEILSDYQVSVPELGTVEASQIPLVFLTSNGTRELSEALKRRCLYLYIDYPDLERERAIVTAKVPDIDENLADQVTRIVRSVRQLDLKKHPSVSETLDWARTLVLLGVERIDAEVAADTANVLLKYRTDIDKAVKEFADNADELAEGAA